MREFKFRVTDGSGEYFYFDLKDFMSKWLEIRSWLGGDKMFSVSSIRQYLGKSKDGVDVYEGDTLYIATPKGFRAFPATFHDIDILDQCEANDD